MINGADAKSGERDAPPAPLPHPRPHARVARSASRSARVCGSDASFNPNVTIHRFKNNCFDALSDDDDDDEMGRVMR